jgi:hypothetical protein
MGSRAGGLRSVCGSVQQSLTGLCSVRRSTPDVQLLGASGLGLCGELLFERLQHTLLFATFIQLENRIARALWGPNCGPESTGRAGSPPAGQLPGTAAPTMNRDTAIGLLDRKI